MDEKKIQSRLGVAQDGVLGPVSWAAMFRHMGATDAADILGREAAEHFQTFGLVTGLRCAHWFGQFAHESKCFRDFEEDLSYSIERLCKVWPSRFPTFASAKPYARNPQALANKVYGHRLGNTAPDDGWRYRGRGPQLTGKENYENAARRTGLPLLSNPDLAADPAHFVLLACDFWEGHRCNEAADDDNLVLVTKRVNGGSVGIQERRLLLERAKRILV
jgi:putative chitinase